MAKKPKHLDMSPAEVARMQRFLAGYARGRQMAARRKYMEDMQKDMMQKSASMKKRMMG